jgi:hypothetical protein
VLEMECKGNISHVCADVARMAACGLCPRRHLACVVHEMQEMQEALSMCRTRDACVVHLVCVVHEVQEMQDGLCPMTHLACASLGGTCLASRTGVHAPHLTSHMYTYF